MRVIDILSMILMFTVIAYIGYKSSKKVASLDDFTLAGSSLGKLQAAFSMAATEFGGSSLVGAMALCYSIGISGAWWDWCAVPALILLGIFFTGKIKLPRLVTITDFFEKRYDYRTKLLASIMHLMAITAQISTQFVVGAVALNGVLGVPKEISILITVVFVLLYTIGGGLISVVNTDIFQFIVIVASICVAVPISLYHVGGFEGLSLSLPNNFLSFTNISVGTVLSWGLFCFFTYSTNQHYIQRVFASKDKATARFAFVFTGCSYFVYGLAVSILGICILALLPNLDDPNMGYALLIRDFMPPGVSGIILGGIFAASMSTADSMLLAASTLFVNDIYKPLLSKKKDSSLELKSIRIVTLIICLFSMMISMFLDNIVDIMYLGGLFYSTSVFFPLVLGLKWKKATAKGAIWSMVFSVVIGLLAELLIKNGFNVLLPSNVLSAATSFVVFVVISYFTEKPKEEDLLFLSE